MKFAFIFIFSLIGHLASASINFSGIWSGSGTSTLSEQTVDCSGIYLETVIQENNFNLKSLHWTCSSTTMEVQPISLKIKGNKLVYNGNQVGTISDDVLFAKTRTSKYLMEFRFTHLDDLKLDYYQKVTFNNGEALEVHGIILKQ